MLPINLRISVRLGPEPAVHAGSASDLNPRITQVFSMDYTVHRHLYVHSLKTDRRNQVHNQPHSWRL